MFPQGVQGCGMTQCFEPSACPVRSIDLVGSGNPSGSSLCDGPTRDGIALDMPTPWPTFPSATMPCRSSVFAKWNNA